MGGDESGEGAAGGPGERTGSDAVLEALQAEGVTTLFGLIGEGNAHLLDRVNDHPVAFRYARHEQVAVSMADGYARTTGSVGVCTLTHGPGVTNGATGIAAADRDGVPLVVLVGDTGFAGRKTALQYLDHAAFTRPIAAAQERVETPGTIAETLRRVFDTARTAPGPVVVELPTDVQTAVAGDDTYRPVERAPQRPRPDPDRLADAVALLESADQPVVLAGGGARAAGAAESVARLAETVGAPVAWTFPGSGLLSPGHPLATGIAGTFMTPASDALLWGADVVVAAGARLSGKATRYGELYRDAAVVQIDRDPAAIGVHRDPDVGVVADADAALAALADACTPVPERTTRVREAIADAGTPAAVETESAPDRIDPRECVLALADLVPDDAVVTVDSGNNTGFPAVFHGVGDDGRLLVNGNFGTMGYALPAALGAQLAAPDRVVLAYTGDGAFMQVLGDVETAVRLELPVVVAVLNDASYGIIRHRQELTYGRTTAADYESPAFADVARGLGARAATVRSRGDLEVVAAFLTERPPEPLVLDVRTIPSVSRPGFPPY